MGQSKQNRLQVKLNNKKEKGGELPIFISDDDWGESTFESRSATVIQFPKSKEVRKVQNSAIKKNKQSVQITDLTAYRYARKRALQQSKVPVPHQKLPFFFNPWFWVPGRRSL